MTTDSDAELALYRESPFPRAQWQPMCRHRTNPAAAEATFEFGRFRLLLRQRQLVADGVPIELGARAFDLLLVLLEADGSLVSKDALLSRVWPGIVVSEENLKVQIFALRKALGEDRDFIRTEFGRGYRFTAAIRSTSASSVSEPPARWRRSHRRLVPQWTSLLDRRATRVSPGSRFDPAHSEVPDPPSTRLAQPCAKESKRGDTPFSNDFSRYRARPLRGFARHA